MCAFTFSCEDCVEHVVDDGGSMMSKDECL